MFSASSSDVFRVVMQIWTKKQKWKNKKKNWQKKKPRKTIAPTNNIATETFFFLAGVIFLVISQLTGRS